MTRAKVGDDPFGYYDTYDAAVGGESGCTGRLQYLRFADVCFSLFMGLVATWGLLLLPGWACYCLLLLLAAGPGLVYFGLVYYLHVDVQPNLRVHPLSW